MQHSWFTRLYLHRQACFRKFCACMRTFTLYLLHLSHWLPGGEDLEQKLLSDVGARGTDSSCKSQFVAALLDELVAGGHRTLVFSQSRVMLDILQVCRTCCCWCFVAC